MKIFRKEGSVKINRVNPNRVAEREAKRIPSIKKDPEARKAALELRAEKQEVRMVRKKAWRKANAHSKYGGHRCFRVLAARAA